MLLAPAMWIPGFIGFAALELVVPIWAERARPTTWHPHHIAERYGLLTLIVLGESVLAATVAIQSVLGSGEALSALASLGVGGLLIVYSMWWVYFDRPVHDLLTSLQKAIVWGSDRKDVQPIVSRSLRFVWAESSLLCWRTPLNPAS